MPSPSPARTDIWNNGDQFRFAYKTLSGNGSITAKVDSLTRSDAWSKAGVMIRESLDAGSKHAMVVINPDNGGSFQYNATGGEAPGEWPGSRPYWLKITQQRLQGGAFSGRQWTQIGDRTSRW
jgi:hypothetical protein